MMNDRKILHISKQAKESPKKPLPGIDKWVKILETAILTNDGDAVG